MLLTTTPTIESCPIREYRGRCDMYEDVLREAKDNALDEMSKRAERMGCNAVVGIDLDYETVGASGSMLMVTCSGTAVVI